MDPNDYRIPPKQQFEPNESKPDSAQKSSEYFFGKSVSWLVGSILTLPQQVQKSWAGDPSDYSEKKFKAKKFKVIDLSKRNPKKVNEAAEKAEKYARTHSNLKTVGNVVENIKGMENFQALQGVVKNLKQRNQVSIPKGFEDFQTRMNQYLSESNNIPRDEIQKALEKGFGILGWEFMERSDFSENLEKLMNPSLWVSAMAGVGLLNERIHGIILDFPILFGIEISPEKQSSAVKALLKLQGIAKVATDASNKTLIERTIDKIQDDILDKSTFENFEGFLDSIIARSDELYQSIIDAPKQEEFLKDEIRKTIQEQFTEDFAVVESFAPQVKIHTNSDVFSIVDQLKKQTKADVFVLCAVAKSIHDPAKRNQHIDDMQYVSIAVTETLQSLELVSSDELRQKMNEEILSLGKDQFDDFFEHPTALLNLTSRLVESELSGKRIPSKKKAQVQFQLLEQLDRSFVLNLTNRIQDYPKVRFLLAQSITDLRSTEEFLRICAERGVEEALDGMYPTMLGEVNQKIEQARDLATETLGIREVREKAAGWFAPIKDGLSKTADSVNWDKLPRPGREEGVKLEKERMESWITRENFHPVDAMLGILDFCCSAIPPEEKKILGEFYLMIKGIESLTESKVGDEIVAFLLDDLKEGHLLPEELLARFTQRISQPPIKFQAALMAMHDSRKLQNDLPQPLEVIEEVLMTAIDFGGDEIEIASCRSIVETFKQKWLNAPEEQKKVIQTQFINFVSVLNNEIIHGRPTIAFDWFKQVQNGRKDLMDKMSKYILNLAEVITFDVIDEYKVKGVMGSVVNPLVSQLRKEITGMYKNSKKFTKLNKEISQELSERAAAIDPTQSFLRVYEPMQQEVLIMLELLCSPSGFDSNGDKIPKDQAFFRQYLDLKKEYFSKLRESYLLPVINDDMRFTEQLQLETAEGRLAQISNAELPHPVKDLTDQQKLGNQIFTHVKNSMQVQLKRFIAGSESERKLLLELWKIQGSETKEQKERHLESALGEITKNVQVLFEEPLCDYMMSQGVMKKRAKFDSSFDSYVREKIQKNLEQQLKNTFKFLMDIEISDWSLIQFIGPLIPSPGQSARDAQQEADPNKLVMSPIEAPAIRNDVQAALSSMINTLPNRMMVSKLIKTVGSWGNLMSGESIAKTMSNMVTTQTQSMIVPSLLAPMIEPKEKLTKVQRDSIKADFESRLKELEEVLEVDEEVLEVDEEVLEQFNVMYYALKAPMHFPKELHTRFKAIAEKYKEKIAALEIKLAERVYDQNAGELTSEEGLNTILDQYVGSEGFIRNTLSSVVPEYHELGDDLALQLKTLLTLPEFNNDLQESLKMALLLEVHKILS